MDSTETETVKPRGWHLSKYAFNHEQARLAGLKSVKARQERKQALIEERLERAVRPYLVTGLHPVILARAKKIERMIQKTESAFLALPTLENLPESTPLTNPTADLARTMATLAQALSTLVKTWCVLTGHEQPAMRKPASAQPLTMLNIPMPEPILDQPSPEQDTPEQAGSNVNP